MVVVGHLKTPESLHGFVYTFHMPLFFVIAGYLFQASKWADKGKEFFLKRAERLIVPYFVLSIFVFYPLYFLIFRHFGAEKQFSYDPIETFLSIFLGQDLYYYLPMWFLPCLFSAEIIFWAICSFVKERTQILISCMIAFVGWLTSLYISLPWGIDIAMVAQVFLLFGYLLRTRNIQLSFFHAIIAMLLLYFVYDSGTGVDMASRRYGSLFYLGGISGAVLVLWISQQIEKMIYFARIFTLMGRESMSIYLWHGVGIKLTSGILVLLFHFSLHEVQTLWGGYTVSVICVSLLILYVKNIVQKKWLKPNHQLLARVFNW